MINYVKLFYLNLNYFSYRLPLYIFIFISGLCFCIFSLKDGTDRVLSH